MIAGVHIVPLRQIPDERGKIMHMMRSDESLFEKFGEIYFSVSHPGVIKGWHVHTRMALNYSVISGMIKLVLFDSREGSKTKGELMELFIGESNYVRVVVPPGVTNGYKTIGTRDSILANCPTEPHDPDEMLRMDPFSDEIPYDWDLRHR